MTHPGGSPRLVALGDSISCGEGVGVRVPLQRTWPALLAGAIGTRHVSLAYPGARVGHVLSAQLQPALNARPEVVTLLIGLNDVLRSRDCEVGADLTRIVVRLVRADAFVLVVRLHDPTVPLPLPASVRTAVRRRVRHVNAALDSAVSAARSTDSGRVAVLDLADLPELARRDAWAVDRLHPSALGHGRIATAAVAALATAGFPTSLPAPMPAGHLPESRSRAAMSSRVNEAAWLVRHGLPYLALNGLRLLPMAAGVVTAR